MKPFIIITFSSVALILVLVLTMLPRVLDNNANKIRVQAFASKALNRETRFDGPLDISFFPGLHLTLHNVHISEDEVDLVTANQADIGFALLPLLTGKVRILSVDLDKPSFSYVGATSSSENPKSVEEPFDMLEIPELSFTGATFNYIDRQGQTSLMAKDCELQMQQLQLAKEATATFLQSLSFTAELSCGELQKNDYIASDLTITAIATDGVISLDPVTIQFLGGQGSGDVQADFSNATAQYQIHFLLPQLNLKDLFNTLPPDLDAKGVLDLTLNLDFEGNNIAALMQSVNGIFFMHGEDLTLGGIDFDEKFEDFESSQNFNLVDTGAFFLAGPLGLLATKGHDFTSLLQQAHGNSEIPSLISDWLITDGLAQAADVAMATRQNRIALHGQLDLVNDQFVDVTIALIDSDGCSLVQQDIGGSFTQPQIDTSNVFTALAGPVLNILQQGAELLTDEKCDVFYSGKVQAPQ